MLFLLLFPPFFPKFPDPGQISFSIRRMIRFASA